MELEALAIALAVIVGWVLKNKTKVSNQAIPVINFALQFLGRLLLELAGGTPAEASVFSALGKAGKSVGDLAWASLATTIVATGGHSSVKATGRAAFQLLKLALLDKLVAAAAKEAEK